MNDKQNQPDAETIEKIEKAIADINRGMIAVSGFMKEVTKLAPVIIEAFSSMVGALEEIEKATKRPGLQAQVSHFDTRIGKRGKKGIGR